MKKKLAFITLTVLILTLCGCSGAKPEATVEKYFSASQQFNLEEMATYIVPTNTQSIEETQSLIQNAEAEEKSITYFLEYLKTNAAKMTYQITSATVDGDTAVVTAETKYVDGGPLLAATIGEAFTKMIGIAFSGVEMTEAETQQMFIDIMKEQSETLGESFKETTLQINCVKQDGTWYITEANDDLLDVTMSGFLSAGKEISDSFGGSLFETEDTTE